MSEIFFLSKRELRSRSSSTTTVRKKISNGKKFTPILAIEGANASGKTQILKALPFLAQFCCHSFSWDPELELAISPFFDSKQPLEFYVEFTVEGVFYRYELTCTEHAVLSEVIFQNSVKVKPIVERKENEVVATKIKFKKLQNIKLRQNASIISTARQYELTELAPLYEFFRWIISNVSYTGLRENPLDMKTVSNFLHRNESALAFVTKFISECDAGVDSVKISKSKGPEDKDEYYYPIFEHKVGTKTHPVTEHTESSGTKALFRILPMYKIVLDVGGVLILDEFDVHLHPLILPKLLNLFLDEETNPKQAQLLVTAHNSELFDLLGRYRVYLINKRDNESFALRLDEIPGDVLRNDRAILPVYQSGKIGGVPRL